MIPLHGLQIGLTWTWGVGLPPGPHPYLVTQVPTWASLGPGNLDLPGPHPDLVTLVTTWASPGPGESGPHLGLTQSCDFVPHLDLITVNSSFASPGTGDSDPNWATPRSGDSGPHLGIIGTSILCSTPEPHLDMMTLNPLRASA